MLEICIVTSVVVFFAHAIMMLGGANYLASVMIRCTQYVRKSVKSEETVKKQ